MRKNTKLILKLVVSVLLISFLFYKVAVNEVYYTLLGVNPFYLILSLFVFFSAFIIGAFSVGLLLIPLKKKIGISKLIRYNILTYSISRFVPGRIGDLSMVYFLKKEDVSIGNASAIVLMDKIITFFVHFCLASFGFFLFFPQVIAIRLAILSIALFFLLIFLITWRRGRNFVKKHILKKQSGLFTGFYKTFSGYFKHFKHLLLINLILAVARVFIFGLLIYFSFLSINQGIDVGILTIMIICSITNIISLIPVTLAGLGIRETSAVFLFSELGILPEFTMSAYIILLVIRYVSSSIVLLIWTWSKKQ